MVKLSTSRIAAAVKLAAKASLAAKGAWVAVDLPDWEGYELQASKGRMYRVQQHESTFIRVRNRVTKCTAWSLTATQVNGAALEASTRSKQLGYAGPVAVDYIPTTHPAHSLG